MSGINQNNVYKGDAVQRSRGILTITYPIERGTNIILVKILCVLCYPGMRILTYAGIAKDWDDVELLLHHMFITVLRKAPDKFPCFVVDSATAPQSYRERLFTCLFEVPLSLSLCVCVCVWLCVFVV